MVQDLIYQMLLIKVVKLCLANGTFGGLCVPQASLVLEA